mmetsp:Transcript_5434/g.20299  ORF Transcript_5434/g.20299 Transcript_5434/m.20299 type:complete len:223 (-) Transcript_5434:2557-3225(-)
MECPSVLVSMRSSRVFLEPVLFVQWTPFAFALAPERVSPTRPTVVLHRLHPQLRRMFQQYSQKSPQMLPLQLKLSLTTRTPDPAHDEEGEKVISPPYLHLIAPQISSNVFQELSLHMVRILVELHRLIHEAEMQSAMIRHHPQNLHHSLLSATHHDRSLPCFLVAFVTGCLSERTIAIPMPDQSNQHAHFQSACEPLEYFATWQCDPVQNAAHPQRFRCEQK